MKVKHLNENQAKFLDSAETDAVAEFSKKEPKYESASKDHKRITKIRRLNETAEFNFNSAASSGNWPYKMSIETYVDICDEISQIIDNLDQSCVFAIARDATNLGLNIDKERLYYSPIVTIENNISPEKINQFRSIVMKYSNGQLNESSNKKFYIDEIVSAQGGKTKTERHFFATLDELKKYCKDSGLTKDDIANCGGCNIKDLCESYAHVKIPRAIKEFVDNLCDEINSADHGEPDEEDEEDEDPWSTEYGYNENLWDRGTGGDYYMDGKPSSYYADEVMEAVIEKFGDVLKTDEQRLAVYCYVEFMDEPEWVDTLSEGAEKLHTKPNGEYLDEPMYNSDEYDDDFDDLSSFNECSDVKRADALYGVERNESLTEARYTDTNGIMGRSGATYSDADLRKAWEDGKDSDPSMQAYNGDFDVWKKDTIGNMNKNEAFDMSYGPDLGKLSWQVASYLDADALGEDKWIEFICDDPRETIGGKKSMGFEAIGEDAHMYGFIRTNGDAVEVQFRNGSEAVCRSPEEIARFIAGEFGISI